MKTTFAKAALVTAIAIGFVGTTRADLIHGLVIDDFEEARFYTESRVDLTGLSPQSCLGEVRSAMVGISGPGSIELDTGKADDAVVFTSAVDYLGFFLTYDLPSPTDLTDGGKFDRLVFRFDALPIGSSVDLVVDVDGLWGQFSATESLFYLNKTVSISLSRFQPTGQAASRIRILLDRVPAGSWITLSDIRLRGSLASLVFVDVPFFSFQFTGPFPVAEATIHTLVEDEAGGFQPSDDIFMALEQLNHLGTPLSGVLEVEDSVPGADPGAAFGFTIADEAMAGKRADHRDGVLFFDTPASQSGETNALVSAPVVQYLPGSKVAFVEYLVETSDGAGVADRRTSYRLRLEIPDARPLAFEQIQVDVVSPTAFQLGFSEIPSAAKSPLESDIILRGELTGSVAPVALSTATPPGASGLSPQIAARPSVWSGSTQLWAQSARGDGVIQVFDAVGREVRRLNLPGQLRFVHWDGRDSAGRQVGSGVYYALYAGVDGSATTKFVRVK